MTVSFPNHHVGADPQPLTDTRGVLDTLRVGHIRARKQEYLPPRYHKLLLGPSVSISPVRTSKSPALADISSHRVAVAFVWLLQHLTWPLLQTALMGVEN